MNGIDIIKCAIRYISVVLTVIIFLMWSTYETNNLDLGRTSFKVWITIVMLIIIGVLVWAWLL